jgi:hypothetical protein
VTVDFLHSVQMVATRPRNKEAHPGLVDIGAQSSQQHLPRLDAKSKKSGDVGEINALEMKLLTEKQERMENAREPSGPSVTRQPHTVPLTAGQPVSLATDRQSPVDTSTYIIIIAALER